MIVHILSLPVQPSKHLISTELLVILDPSIAFFEPHKIRILRLPSREMLSQDV